MPNDLTEESSSIPAPRSRFIRFLTDDTLRKLGWEEEQITKLHKQEQQCQL